MREIPLTQGYVALVDDEDYEWLSRVKWSADVNASTVYAVRSVGGKAVRMHQLLVSECEHVDHINGNGLDNRRVNLRASTAAENLRNRGKQANNTSGYKGVSWHKTHNKWVAQIKTDQRNKTLGYFTCPIEAAKARDKAALELHGEFAYLNFPQEVACEDS